MPIGGGGVARAERVAPDPACQLLDIMADPQVYRERLDTLDAKTEALDAKKAEHAAEHKRLNDLRAELEIREKAVEKRETDAGERVASADAKDTKLTEREAAVKDRWVECRQVETENRRQADKLEARAKALRDAAELLLQHDAMES